MLASVLFDFVFFMRFVDLKLQASYLVHIYLVDFRLHTDLSDQSSFVMALVILLCANKSLTC